VSGFLIAQCLQNYDQPAVIPLAMFQALIKTT